MSTSSRPTSVGASRSRPTSASSKASKRTPSCHALSSASAAKEGTDWLVLSNESLATKRAFWFVQKLVAKSDDVHLLNVNTEDVDDAAQLDFHMKNDDVRASLDKLVNAAETQAIGQPEQEIDYRVHGHRLTEGESIHDIAFRFISRHKIRITAVGSMRCNQKEFDESIAANVMGTLNRSEHACAIMVIKSTYVDKFSARHTNKKCHFLVCVDGSKASENAFDEVLKFKAHGTYTAYMIHPDPNQDSARAVVTKYQKKLEEAEAEGKVEAVVANNEAAEERVAGYAEDAEADMVVLGCERKGPAYLGSFTKHVLKHSRRHVMVCFPDTMSGL